MERESGAKIGIISTGPDRDQTFEMPEFRQAMQRITGR
jgi:adenylosuccinate synthase